MRLLAYTPVRTEAQADSGAGLEAQLDACHKYAAEHGTTIDQAFRDEGRIAKKLDKLADNINKLLQGRKEVLQETITQRAYSAKGAALLLGISLMTVRRLMAVGKLKFFPIGNQRIRITADQIELFQNSVTINEAAKILGVHSLTIRRLIKAGRLKATVSDTFTASLTRILNALSKVA